MIDINELRRLAQAALVAPDGLSVEWMDRLGQFQEFVSPAAITELLDRLEAAERERDELRTQNEELVKALTDILTDLEERAKWNMDGSQRVVSCGAGVYVNAKAALEKYK